MPDSETDASRYEHERIDELLEELRAFRVDYANAQHDVGTSSGDLARRKESVAAVAKAIRRKIERALELVRSAEKAAGISQPDHLVKVPLYTMEDLLDEHDADRAGDDEA